MAGRDDSRREESGAERLAALLRNDATEAVDDNRERARWQRLLRAAHRDDERALHRLRFRRSWLAVPGIVGMAVLAVGLFIRLSEPSQLRFRVDGRDSSEARLVAEADQVRRLDFSDGSELVLHASSRLRVTDTAADGATLALERGQLDLSIRHRPSTRWRLGVGPYVVAVTGTRFKVRWDPEAGDIVVEMLDGSVVVQGPGVAGPIKLQVGQRFHANRSGQYTIRGSSETRVDAQPASGTPSASEIHAAAPRAPQRTTIASSLDRSGGRQDKACEWDGLVSQGRFDVALARARAMGIDVALASCAPRSLFALADAARYRGQFDLSGRVLKTIRSRSPDEAGKAAFFLGRLEEARGNDELALRWYTAALDGNAEPPFVEEARAARTRVSKRIVGAPSPPSHADP